MKISLVMTIIGNDRPGLVEWLASLVAEHEGNWLECHMARLAGQFAGILRVEVDPAKKVDLTRALQQLSTRGLQVVVQASEPANALATLRLCRLELIGHDRPGIVRQISRIISAKGVNVEELATEIVSAPMTGEPLFKANALLRVPTDKVALEDLRHDLEQVGHDLMVDIKLEAESGA